MFRSIEASSGVLSNKSLYKQVGIFLMVAFICQLHAQTYIQSNFHFCLWKYIQNFVLFCKTLPIVPHRLVGVFIAYLDTNNLWTTTKRICVSYSKKKVYQRKKTYLYKVAYCCLIAINLSHYNCIIQLTEISYVQRFFCIYIYLVFKCISWCE